MSSICPRRLSFSVLVVAPLLCGWPGASHAQLGQQTCEVDKQVNVPAEMRDGTVLFSDVYRPAGSGDYPVLLMRLPYDKSEAQTYVYAKPEFYASHCYIVVIQDVRGQYTSEGTFYAFRDEMQDGYDTVEWAARLPGSKGKVGMYGFSYVGATQWLAATQKPPHLVAISPAMTASDYYDGWSYQGGAFSLAFNESWPLSSIARTSALRLGDQAIIDRMTVASEDLQKAYEYLPVSQFPWLSPDSKEAAPYFYDWVEHDTWDHYWKQWSLRTRYQDIRVPALNFEGWYDVFLLGGIENFVNMRRKGGSEIARNGQQLVIGPWIHLPWDRKVGDFDFGQEADNPIDALQIRWFDHWLKGQDNGLDKDPAVRVFVMGANTWRAADDWPIPGTEFTKYYLHSGGAANSRFGNGTLATNEPDGTEPTDRYVYDPANPGPSAGGHSCCTPDVAPVGPADQAKIEERADVLVYSTPPLEEPIEITGPIELVLYAASSAVDTDFTAKLVDVHPDGRVVNLNNGIIRASYRESLENPEPIEPGKIYRYAIEIWPTSNLFRAGHQIRLEISSSNFPHYARNLNTGAEFGATSEMTKARQTIYHDAKRPSHVVLPIMPQPMAANP
jgi:uncharacterized protein